MVFHHSQKGKKINRFKYGLLSAVFAASGLFSIQSVYAADYDFSEVNPVFDDEVLTLDYTKSIGETYGESSVEAVTALDDGGYAVLISYPCDQNSDGTLGTSSTQSVRKKSQKKSATSNKSNDVDRYVDFECAVVAKYTASGNEVWRTDAIKYNDEGEDRSIFTSGSWGYDHYIFAFTDTDEGIVLLTNSFYTLISFDGTQEVSELAKADTLPDGISNHFYGNKNYVPVSNDGSFVLPAGDYNNILVRYNGKGEIIAQSEEFDDEIDGVWKTTDGYILYVGHGEYRTERTSWGTSTYWVQLGGLHYINDALSESRKIPVDCKNTGIACQDILVLKDGNFIIPNWGDGSWNDERETNQYGWHFSDDALEVYDIDGNFLYALPEGGEKEIDESHYAEFELEEGLEYAGMHIGGTKWLMGGEMSCNMEYSDDYSSYGLAYFDTSDWVVDCIPEYISVQKDDGNYTYYWEPSDAAVLKDGSIIATGKTSNSGWEEAMDEEEGKHYDIVCPDGWDGCSNGIIKRYIFNKLSVEIAESDEGVAVTNLEDNSNVSQDTEVKLTITPKAGYRVKKITVTAADGTAISVSDNSFIMPATNVTVSVEYEIAPLDIVNPATADGMVFYATIGLFASLAIAIHLNKIRKVR